MPGGQEFRRFPDVRVPTAGAPCRSHYCVLTGMVCRIDVARSADAWTVHVAGRLAAANVEDLVRVCREVAPPIRIDLTDLMSIDAAGVCALRRLAASGAELCGVAHYLKHELSRT